MKAKVVFLIDMMQKIIDFIPSWSIGIGFLLLVVGLIFLLFKRKISIGGKLFSLTNSLVNPEGLALAFEKVLDTQFNIVSIELKFRLREQMGYAEDRLKEIKKALLDTFSDYLFNAGYTLDHIHQSHVMDVFEKIVFKMIISLKNEMRDRFEEIYSIYNKEDNVNCEFSYIKGSFEKYLTNVSGVLVQDAKDFVFSEWVENDLISRQDFLKKINIFESVENLIKDILLNGVKVQLKYVKKIKAMREDQKFYIKKVTAN